jgi:hypothetical protein
MIIDLNNSRIIVMNSAAKAWDRRILFLNIFKNGELPKWLGIENIWQNAKAQRRTVSGVSSIDPHNYLFRNKTEA